MALVYAVNQQVDSPQSILVNDFNLEEQNVNRNVNSIQFDYCYCLLFAIERLRQAQFGVDTQPSTFMGNIVILNL